MNQDLNNNKEFGFTNLGPGRANNRALSVRKISANIARNLGYSKANTRFLAKVASIFNSRDSNMPIWERAEEVLNWISRYEVELCARLTWTKASIEKARIVISRAAELEIPKSTLLIEEENEAIELGRILGYVEQLTEFTITRRRQKRTRRNRIIDDRQGTERAISLESLIYEASFFESLPKKVRNHLNREFELKLAA